MVCRILMIRIDDRWDMQEETKRWLILWANVFFFDTVIGFSVRKEPKERSTARDLLSHSFLRNAVDEVALGILIRSAIPIQVRIQVEPPRIRNQLSIPLFSSLVMLRSLICSVKESRWKVLFWALDSSDLYLHWWVEILMHCDVFVSIYSRCRHFLRAMD